MKFHKNTIYGIIHALKNIFEENCYADKAIEQILKSNPKWGSRDRRFIAETTYDIVRWYRLLSSILPGNENNDWEKIFNVYCVMKGFIKNKIISKKLEEQKTERKFRESVPDWLDELGIQELGKERWEKEINALNKEAKVILRTNTIKTNSYELRKILKKEKIETEILNNEALVLTKRQNIFSSESFKKGLFEIQDFSSQLVAHFLQPTEKNRVIDACAGAGGKTLHLAALMKNKGKIIALDTNSNKLKELKKRAIRAGTFNIEIRHIKSLKTIKRLENSADRLLLDVPCSGLGVLRRNPDIKWKLSSDSIERVKTLQKEILSKYSTMLKPGGIMVYSTCSILPSENEKQIHNFLSENSYFELLEEKTIYPSEGYDGFYMARLKKL